MYAYNVICPSIWLVSHNHASANIKVEFLKQNFFIERISISADSQFDAIQRAVVQFSVEPRGSVECAALVVWTTPSSIP